MAILKKCQWPEAKDHTAAINDILAGSFFQHHNPFTHRPVRNKYNIVKDGDTERVEECRELVVHTFTLGDVEDPDLMAAEPLWKWEKSDFGQWVMKNAADTPTWHRTADPTTFGYRYQIRAKFMGPALTEILLRKG
jgi:hypothetical protein